ncbi:MAG: VanZ family protein [Alphaproteobacteria bacterium]
MVFCTLGFAGFILWIVYLANTGGQSIFFDFIRSFPHGDKLGHLALFGFLTLLANFACGLKTISFRFFRMYLGAVLVLAFALIEELSQFFVVSRTLDAIDLLADVAGILVFSVLTYYIRLWKMKNESTQYR